MSGLSRYSKFAVAFCRARCKMRSRCRRTMTTSRSNSRLCVTVK
jgi:hypothetical protein